MISVVEGRWLPGIGVGGSPRRRTVAAVTARWSLGRWLAAQVLKAAAFSLTQSLRSLLATRGIRVHAVLTGPTDTDMTRGFEVPKATPRAVAEAILTGVERDEEDIFPDPLAETVADDWRRGAVKALEGQLAALAAA